MAASRHVIALTLSSILGLTSFGCDSSKPSTESPSATPPAASKTPETTPAPTAEKEEPKDDFCATLLTTFTPKDNQYYYIVINPCVKMDANYNTNIEPYLKEFRTEIAKTPGFDPSGNVSLIPQVIKSEAKLKEAISKLKGEPKELVLNVKK